MKKNNKYSPTPETVEKIRQSMKRLHKTERFRVMSGMKQKTKYRYNIVPQKNLRVIANLRHRYKYFRDMDVADGYTLFYDEQTQRCREEYYTKKYGLKFKQA